jgi:hypothetical protein
MLQGHCFDAFIRPDLRKGMGYMYSQFVGGMPPALFLFLTGVTLAFLLDSTERKNLPWRQRFLTALNRSGYLFLLAFAFRFQLFLFALSWDWKGLLHVDILNCMGFAIGMMSIMTFVRTRQRVWLAAVLGLGIAFASPLVRGVGSGWPLIVREYVVPTHTAFGFFPWGCFLVFGVSMGSLIRLVKEEGTSKLMQWSAVAGAATLILCQFFARIPSTLYPKPEFWLDSPLQILNKLGVLLLLVSAAFLWTRFGVPHGWSWVRQFGTTSLLVYWVHIEIVYGHATHTLHNALNVPQTILAAICIILLMLILSTIKTHWRQIRAVFDELGWTVWPKGIPKTQRASAD